MFHNKFNLMFVLIRNICLKIDEDNAVFVLPKLEVKSSLSLANKNILYITYYKQHFTTTLITKHQKVHKSYLHFLY